MSWHYRHDHVEADACLGASGIAFLHHLLNLPSPPRINILIRTPSKLPSDLREKINVVVEGDMNDEEKIEEALQEVTTVVSLLVRVRTHPSTQTLSFSSQTEMLMSNPSKQGAYATFTNLIWRDKPTPIADALVLIIKAMKKRGIKRILALSTPAHSLPGERVRPSLTNSLSHQRTPPHHPIPASLPSPPMLYLPSLILCLPSSPVPVFTPCPRLSSSIPPFKTLFRSMLFESCPYPRSFLGAVSPIRQADI